MPNHTELLDLLLSNRGIIIEDRERFLNPSYEEHLYDPFKMRDMERACVRIFEATEAKEKIVIYSDYDCDGIPASVIMHDFFEKINYTNYSIYIPDRHDEGYGLHHDAIDQFIVEEVKLLITFDLGITAVEEVAKAQASGIDVVITDHHLPLQKIIGGQAQEELPRAYAILNPKQDGCDYPDKMLCGAGVAFKLVQALVKKYGEYWKINNGWEKWLLDMAGVATLSDQVPLLNENRILVTFGLKEINKTRRVGLNSLMKASGVIKGQIDSHTLGHILAPRLNASGRLEEGIDSLRLLCTKDRQRASDLAQKLNNVNRHRQALTKNSLDLAHSIIKETSNLVFVHSDTFHQGVIGLIAGKLVETYHRPAIVVSVGSEFCKASARSVKGVNIVELIKVASDLLVSVGGHPMAAGFTVKKEKLNKLEKKLLASSQILIKTEDLTEKRLIDLELDIAFLNWDLYREIQQLSPFGQANPPPLFAGFNNTVLDYSLVGRDKNHLKLLLSSKLNSRKAFSAIGFNFSPVFPELKLGALVDIIYQIEEDNWNHLRSLILKLKDVRLSEI